ncbi:MAG: cupin domain-containing protein [Alphaproteobacteria bacterium]|nr:cupin domain-containing protein [Alphaproteobacteria bacterium]
MLRNSSIFSRFLSSFLLFSVTFSPLAKCISKINLEETSKNSISQVPPPQNTPHSNMIIKIPTFKKLTESILETARIKVRRLKIEPGKAVPWHYHTKCIDIIFPIAGKAILRTENEEISLINDTFYIIDINKKHSIKNVGNEAFFYLLFQPGSYDFIHCNPPLTAN